MTIYTASGGQVASASIDGRDIRHWLFGAVGISGGKVTLHQIRLWLCAPQLDEDRLELGVLLALGFPVERSAFGMEIARDVPQG